MTMYVLDASVVVKWFSHEEDTDKALALRDKIARRELDIVVPDMILYELSNALRYNADFNDNDVKRAINSLFDLDIEIVAHLMSTIDAAIDLAYEYDISIYDAFYIALADELDCSLVTADMKLYEKVKQLVFIKELKNI
jgi:predicted nucleic acid-binding protein